MIAIEAVERAGELERVGRELMDTIVLTYVVDELREPQNEPDEVELALCRKECGVRAIRVDAALIGRSQDARDARVRVLHVVDGVLVRLLHRELEIEVELPVGARLQEEVPRRVLADCLDDLLEQQELSSTPSHPLEHALVQEADILVEDHLELLEQVERLHRRAHLDQVVVRVRPPDVDLLVEAPFPQRLDVVCDVLAEIARLAVRTNEDPALLVVDLAERAQLGERPLEFPRPHHLRLREPGVVADAEHRRDALGIAEDPLDAERRETLGLLLQRELHPFVAVARLYLGRDVLHVLGWIRIGGYLDLLAVELAVTDRDGPAERVELCPGVLDVVLTLDGRARELEDRREHVAEWTAARVRDRERPRGIRGDELDLHPLAGERLGATELGTRSHDLVYLGGDPLLVESHVNEAAQLLDRRDRRRDADSVTYGLRDLARGLARALRELQRDVRRVVAVLRVSRALDVDGHAVDVSPSELRRGAREAVLDRGGDLIANGHGHPRESGTASVRAPTSPLGSWVAKSRQVRRAARPYAITSVTRLTVKPSGPSRARIAPERTAPTAFAALHASAKKAFAPARSAGVNDES